VTLTFRPQICSPSTLVQFSTNVEDGETDMPPWYANSHIFATSVPIHFMFDSRVFRVAGSNGAISAYIKSKMAAPRLRQPPSWKILNGRIFAKGHAVHFILRLYFRGFRAPTLRASRGHLCDSTAFLWTKQLVVGKTSSNWSNRPPSLELIPQVRWCISKGAVGDL